jgi:16S rRNA (adenine1518-N6/adenine1519-N6)-dimethyltransferase
LNIPRKRFGQHFLHDRGIIRRIIDAIDPQTEDRLVEIGPGRGALTWPLLARSGRLDVVEIDRDLAQVLKDDARGAGTLSVIVADALKFDFLAARGGGAPLRIVGNLPYNISTPLMFHLIEQRAAIADMFFMLQQEVVDRMVAPPGGGEYGRLTVMLAAYCEAEKLFDVGPGAFTPAPKVWSSIVRLRPHATPRFDFGSDAGLQRVVSRAFMQRRKTLRNSLRELLDAAAIEACGIDPQRRPETLTPHEFGKLAKSWAASSA